MMTILGLSLFVVLTGVDNKLFNFLIFLVALGGIGLTEFHIGVEQKWWAMPESCISKIALEPGNAEQMLKALQEQSKNQKLSRCDEINWRLFGIPASWLTCLAFMFSTILIGWREWTVPKR